MTLRTIPFATAAIDGVAHALAGGIQRVAWENENFGMFTTGAMVIGGLVAQSMTRPGDLLDTIAKAAFNSGSSTVGWLIAEKQFNYGGIGSLAGRLPGGQKGRRPLGGVTGSPMNGHSGRAPEASLTGVNPNTGEEIRSSRV